MTYNIDFSPQVEQWINTKSQQIGIPPVDVVRRVIEETVANAALVKPIEPAISEKNAAAIAMLDRWIAEDATDDPEEIRKADEEVAEFKRNMNANRAATGERLVFFEPTHST